MGSNMDRLKKQQDWCLVAAFSIALLLRMIPSVKYGLPYGFDIYEFVSRVFVLNEGGSVSLPHGPLFYYLQLMVLKAAGYDMFMKILTFVEPIVFTFFILPPYFVSKQFKTEGNKPVYTLLYLAATNLLVHQIGGVIIPEGLGILFYGLSILFSMRALTVDWRWMLPAMLSGFLTVMSHHLSAFQLILFFISLFLSYLYCFLKHEKNISLLRLLVLMFTTIILLFASSASVWSLAGEEENMLRLILNMILEKPFLLLPIAAAMLLFPLITVKIVKFVKKYRKFTFVKTFTSILLASVIIPIALTVMLHPDALPTILWFTVPISLGFLPFTIHGLIQYCKKSSLYEALFFIAPLMVFMVESSFLLSLEGYRVLIHRIPTFIIYFATPLAGYGLSCFSVELRSMEKEYLAGMMVAYFIFSLAFTSYPKPEFTYGIKESISYSDLTLTEDAYGYSLLFNSKIDTDTRLGALLMFVSRRNAFWIGNLTSWFLPSNSWLVNVSVTGKPYPVEKGVLIVVSDAMRETYGGRVVNLVTKPSGSLGEEAIDYLNNSPGIDRLEDVQNGAIYMLSPWKKLNCSGNEPPGDG
ncbi:MAG: hypothetical protein JTT13_00215 [Candidatus Brockarchaeota archaeon]|nr:hypothetical protein [Candidatus Brockarchaeota archaeon]